MNLSVLVVGFWILGASLFLTKHRGRMTKAEKITVMWSLLSILVFASVADASANIDSDQLRMEIDQLQKQINDIDAWHERVLEWEREADFEWKKLLGTATIKPNPHCRPECLEVLEGDPLRYQCDLECQSEHEEVVHLSPLGQVDHGLEASTLLCVDCESKASTLECIDCESDAIPV